ncbi:MAG TPA: response regulator transcription factor [Kofleriaceae bacterium]|jgi:two-component system response regulator MtrA
MRVLIDVANGRVHDDLVELLRRGGHVVERGSAGVSARRFDVIVVGSAEAAGKLARAHPTRAIIVFTRVGDVEARIAALQAGAADAVDRGFAMSQVAVRIESAGHRAALVPPAPEVIEIDGCTIDLSAATCTRDGHAQPLTHREVELVRWLARRARQVVSREELLEHVWGLSPRTATRAVDVAVAALRGKLERDAAEPTILVTVKGAGYRWG